MQRSFIFPLILVIISYSSTMAIISLFLSVSWKKFEKMQIKILPHIFAILISFVAFISREPLLLIGSQFTLLLLTAVLAFISHKKSKKFSKLFMIYSLLFLFWMIGLMPFSSRMFLPHGLIPLFYIISLFIFVIIVYKVHKKVK